jgi:ABC-type polysaccharide/polyol phosphate export permease/tetratricopeptide (TPR) repeat protein
MFDDAIIVADAAARTDEGSDAAARIAARAAELFNAGDVDAAVAQCERLGDDADLAALDICVWVASNAGRRDLTRLFLTRAAALAPGDAGRHFSLSHACCAERDFESALVAALRASELAPDDPRHWLHIGAVLNELRLYAEALPHLIRTARAAPDAAEAYHHLAWAAQQLGRVDYAAPLALRAYRLEQANGGRASFAAHLLAAVGQRASAIAVLDHCIERGGANAGVHRAMAGLVFESGDAAGALAHVDAALALEPGHVEFQVFRSGLLYRLGEFERAAEAAEGALKADPGNLPVRRHAVTLFLEAGRLPAAIAATAELLRLAPEEAEYISCMRHVLNVRADVAQAIPGLLEAKRNAGPRRRPPTPTLGAAIATQGRVIMALVLREMRTRFGDSRFGYLWVIIELVVHIAALAVVFQFTMHGQPPLGTSFFFFYFTGLLPYLLFSHTVSQVGNAIIANRPLLQLPPVGNLDVVIARGLLEFATELVVGIVFIGGFLAFGVDAIPRDLGLAFGALAATWALGLGIGLINAVINVFTHVWDHIFQVLLRMVYFGSGIFYVPQAMPEWVRDILWWNPLLHCVDWFRMTFFADYEPAWLNRAYPLEFALFALLVGMALEFGLRRRLRRAT